MATVNLSEYSSGELKGLQRDVEREIKVRQQQHLRGAREQILAIVQQAGVSVEELLATTEQEPRGRQRQKVKPQFRNPSDDSQTWTGRGRQPRWVAEAIAQGKTLDDFRI